MKEFNLTKRIISNKGILTELKSKFQKSEFKNFDTKALIGDNDDVDFKELGKQLNSPKVKLSFAQEAIINIIGRPVIEIANDSFDVNEPELDFWKEILKRNKKGLEKIIPSVGRIELKGHPSMDWVGTGWLLYEDYIITNRHVANEFARRNGENFVFKRNFLNDEYECLIDFKEELGSSETMEYKILKVLHIEPDSGYDMAILQISWDGNNSKFQSFELTTKVKTDETIATIGYPARDSRTLIPDEQIRIFSNVFNKKRLAVGEIDYIDPDNRFFIHDCTTLGGNSGSPIVDIETQKVYGLHFAGREGQGNFAVPANIIEQIFKSRIQNQQIFISSNDSSQTDNEEKITVQDLADRNGYNEDFLNQKIPFPSFSRGMKKELVRPKGAKSHLLNYINYSLVMSKEKRLALVTAVNIDGTKWRHVTRGTDRWLKDPRINRKEQVGNELYKYNNFDRGHLVRRLDPAWGNSFKEAKEASDDTFFYTNCAPQHKNLNQKIWLGLEEYILSNTTGKGMKVSVFNGPIFSDDDMFYRGIQIPESFWKVVIANNGSNEVHVTAYILSQKKWLDDIEFVFGEYQTSQVPISFLQQQTGLIFNKSVQQADAMANINESVNIGLKINQINDLSNIVL